VGLVVRLGSIKANFAEHNITLSAFAWLFSAEDLKPRKKITNQFYLILTTIF